jgi:predicted ATPase
MQKSVSSKSRVTDLPFVGRDKEVVQLQQLYARRRHVLILGPEGVGKTAFIEHLRELVSLVWCSRSTTLREICESLERELGLEFESLRLVPRKNRLLATLARSRQPIVFDDVGWTTPKISSFLENAMERAPVWICSRSELAREIGHFWPLLVRFERVELRSFRFSETRALLAAAIERGLVPPAVARFASQLHRISAGLPRVLRELLEQFAAGNYDLSRPAGLQLLELDCHIKDLRQAIV